MKKICVLFLNSILLTTCAFSQGGWNRQWDKRFGTPGDDALDAFIETTDGGFLLGGYTTSGISGDKTEAAQGGEDFWIVKTDAFGNKQWDKRYGGSGDDWLYSFQQTSDGGYILGGSSASGAGEDKSEASQGNTDYWIIKTDSLGNKQWDKRFGGTLDDYLHSVKQTTDGGYILGGWTFSNLTGDMSQPSRGNSDYWVVKTDASGNKQWDMRYGGTGADELFALQQTADGGYILGGSSRSGATGDKTDAAYAGTNDYWIVKINSGGTKQWDKRFGNNNEDEMYEVLQTPDHGYLLAGWSSSGLGSDKSVASYGAADIWIVKTDSTGGKEWNNAYGGSMTEDISNGSISMTADGGYLFGATSGSPASGDKSENNLGSQQTWVVKLNASGAVQWDKTIFTTGHDESGFVTQTKDGCYVVANYTDAGIGGYKSQDNRDSTDMKYDFWIAKFCPDGIQTAPPVAAFNASGTILCEGDCISFVNHSQNGLTYQWLFPGGFPASSTDASPSGICYYTPGSFDAKLIVSNTIGADSVTFIHLIHIYNVPPTPSVLQSNDTLFCSFDPSYSSYQWYADTMLIPGATHSFFVISGGGNYSVQVANATGCRVAVGTNTILGMQQLTGNGLPFTVSPNPAQNEIRINSSYAEEELRSLKINICNLLGEKVAPEATFSHRSSIFINISALSPGMYFVQAIGGKQRWIERFAKQ